MEAYHVWPFVSVFFSLVMFLRSIHIAACTRTSLLFMAGYGSDGKEIPAMRATWIRSLGWKDPLEEETATHSSVLAWRIPRTEEPGRLQFMGSRRVRHDRATKYSTARYSITGTDHTCLSLNQFKCILTFYTLDTSCALSQPWELIPPSSKRERSETRKGEEWVQGALMGKVPWWTLGTLSLELPWGTVWGGQPSPFATAAEPVHHRGCNRRSHRNEKPVHRSEEWPLVAEARESLHAATKTQSSQKIK